MITHLTPGIYRRPRPSDKAGVALVRTDVAGFVGFAERGPIVGVDPTGNPADLAVKIESWAEFQRVFGGPIVNGYLAYAVRGFFANGGRRCYVVRVGATSDPSRSADRPTAASLPLPRASGRGAVFGLAQGTAFAPGARHLKLAGVDGLAPGDLVAVEGDGFREFTVVKDIADDDTVRLAHPLPASPTSQVQIVRYESAMRVRAIAPVVVGANLAGSPGSWGNRIRLDFAPLEPGYDAEEFSLRVTVEPGRDTTRPPEVEFYRRVSMASTSPYFAPNIINGTSSLIEIAIDIVDDGLRLDLTDGPLGNPAFVPGKPMPAPLAAGGIRTARLRGGRDGLAAVKTVDFTGGLDDLRGLRILEEVDEVSILVCPDAAFRPVGSPNLPPTPAPDPCGPKPSASSPSSAPADSAVVPPAIDTVSVARAMLDQCERLRDRVAIIDPLDRLDSSNPNERKDGPARTSLGAFFDPPKGFVAKTVTDWRALFSSAFGAMYYPWLRMADPLGVEGPTRRVPPGGHIAGVYAQFDALYGVQRPPANVALLDVTDVAAEVNSTQQELLNPCGVNAIRSFAGRGIRVWGARSLEPSDVRWQFIHVRRLMSMIEKSVGLSTQWAVFEPNDVSLRNTLTHSLTVFLRAIWNTGGLDGAAPSDGFYVKCDETNNPPEVVGAGQIVCQVGVAPVAPMEFIDFEITQTPDGSQVVES